jgi:hypothetical protein
MLVDNDDQPSGFKESRLRRVLYRIASYNRPRRRVNHGGGHPLLQHRIWACEGALNRDLAGVKQRSALIKHLKVQNQKHHCAQGGILYRAIRLAVASASRTPTG